MQTFLSVFRGRIIAMIGLLALCSVAHVVAGGSREGAAAPGAGLQVVAAENFYGDVVSQIAGTAVQVTSIMADPNVDPHEYESSVNDSKAVADALLVVENGGGYDAWMDKLIAASPNTKRIVVKGFDVAPTKLPENEHVWYNVDNMAAIAGSIEQALASLDPTAAPTFDANLARFRQSLGSIRDAMAQIKASFPGAPIGLTETIYLYQAEPMGLNVLTPFEFQKAIAEGNDPPADSVVAALSQITKKQIKVLVYNEQTVDPVTTRLQDAAKRAGIPIVPVTETMPAGMHYQTWMTAQLTALSNALTSASGS